MAITNLQQARQMYALGQRVAKTMDGSRPGYKGREDAESQYGGDYSNTGQSLGGGTGDAREDYRSKQYTNLPTPTVTVGVDKKGNPITVPTTYTAKRDRQQMLDALNAKGISSFDPRVTKTLNFLNPNNLVTSFAPKQKSFGILDLALMAATGGLLGGKAKTVAGLYSKGKFALDKAKQFSTLAETIGLTDKNVIDSFTDNLSNLGKGTSKETTVTNNDRGNGEGLASLENQASNYNEYILLLQKLQAGTISDAERNRYNVLKNMLGI